MPKIHRAHNNDLPIHPLGFVPFSAGGEEVFPAQDGLGGHIVLVSELSHAGDSGASGLSEWTERAPENASQEKALPGPRGVF